MHEVYILQSEKDLSYYIGEAPNSDERLIFHNSGRQRYTRSRIPWMLIYSEKHENRYNALIREKQIKRKKSRKYIGWLIKNKK